jgi:hypothetical protein
MPVSAGEYALAEGPATCIIGAIDSEVQDIPGGDDRR